VERAWRQLGHRALGRARTWDDAAGARPSLADRAYLSRGDARSVRSRLPDWAAFARQTDDPEWQAHLGHKAYCVETMCCALHTLATGEAQTKPQAVSWALATLPEPWRATVERSQAWRGVQTHDDSLNAEVRRFVLWIAAQAAL
jgi:hypothetical protein